MRFPTKAIFKQYLLERLDSPVGLPGAIKGCPLAQCLMSQGYKKVRVSVHRSKWATDYFPKNYKTCKTPKWAAHFIQQFDSHAKPLFDFHAKPLQQEIYTGREALKFLRR